ncbi:hypothetical protein [Brevundimonas sp.]|nr:hypothetical protein [Brevundimonas sp.]MDZ4362245.1 hypothetical protein [Brevundimonas sp.]
MQTPTEPAHTPAIEKQVWEAPKLEQISTAKARNGVNNVDDGYSSS